MQNRILVLLMVLTPFSTAQAFHVMIDPGHGGTDTGAVHGSLRESDLVLKVALKLRELLTGTPGLQASLTRDRDRGVSLPERVRLAETAQADLLVSLHANSAPDAKARGVEVFFQNSLPADEEALYLANLENQSHLSEDLGATEDPSKRGDIAAILEDLKRQSRMSASLKFAQILSRPWNPLGRQKGLTIKQAPLFVLTRSAMPSVLVEIGFLTHPGESRKLATEEHRNELATRIRDSILEYRDKYAPTRRELRSAALGN